MTTSPPTGTTTSTTGTTTATTTTGNGSATVRAGRIRTVAVLLGAGGVLLGLGGQLHPIAEDDTLPAALATMTGDRLWTIAHLLLLGGLLVAAIGFASAYRHRVLGPALDTPLRIAILGYSLGALELVPHLLAARDHAELGAGEITGLVRVHLVLEAFSVPAVALSTIVLAVALARSARTRPAWALAVVAIVGGTAFGLAGPLVTITEEPAVAALFAGEFAVAVWLVGTGIRLARR